MWLTVCKGSLKYPDYVLFLLLLIRITYFLFTYSMKEAGLGHKQWRGGPISSNCKQCPVVYTNPVCGSDGHTYSSQVRIKYRTELYFQCSLQFQLLDSKILEILRKMLKQTICFQHFEVSQFPSGICKFELNSGAHGFLDYSVTKIFSLQKTR